MTEVLSALPAGSQLSGIQFVEPTNETVPILDLSPPIRRHAIITETNRELEILSVPNIQAVDHDTTIINWVSPNGQDQPGYHLLTLHGTTIHCCLPRIAIVAPVERWKTIQKAVIESAYLELELRTIETELAERWPELEADAPMAFEFQERAMKSRPVLAKRYQRLLLLRSRLTKITPRLMIPLAYPPTVASQIQERFRERFGVVYRVESLASQFEMFERIYDNCSQRASEYVHTRKSLALEWVIIILLLTQIVIVLIEYLSTTTPTTSI